MVCSSPVGLVSQYPPAAQFPALAHDTEVVQVDRPGGQAADGVNGAPGAVRLNGLEQRAVDRDAVLAVRGRGVGPQRGALARRGAGQRGDVRRIGRVLQRDRAAQRRGPMPDFVDALPEPSVDPAGRDPADPAVRGGRWFSRGDCAVT